MLQQHCYCKPEALSGECFGFSKCISSITVTEATSIGRGKPIALLYTAVFAAAYAAG